MIALPILLAARSVFAFNGAGFLVSFFALFVFSIFCAGLGAVAVFLSARASSAFGHNTERFRLFVLFSVLIVLIAGYGAWGGVVNNDIGELFQIEDIERDIATTERISDNFKYYPSHLPAVAIHKAQTGNIAGAFDYLGSTIALLVAVLAIYSLLAKKFLYLWQIFAEGGFEARESLADKNEPDMLYALTTKLTNPTGAKTSSAALFKKELLENFRTAKNMLWAGFLALLMFLNIFLVSVIGDHLETRGGGEMAGILPSLQLAVILFFVGAFVIRFVFPAFSQEGRASWILGSSPINLRELFFQKMKVYTILGSAIVVLGSVMFFANSPDILASPIFSDVVAGFQWIIFLPSVLILSAAVVIAGLSLGVVFVNFEIEDPQLMSTSLPGMSLVLAFLLAGFMGGFALYEFILGTSVYLLVLLPVVAALAAISVIYALRALGRIEFS